MFLNVDGAVFVKCCMYLLSNVLVFDLSLMNGVCCGHFGSLAAPCDD